jgi:YHYH protein/Fibronectin type III domain
MPKWILRGGGMLAAVFAVQACGSGSSGGTTAATTTAPSVPGAPTIGAATAGDGQASVAFTAPAATGSSAITGYTATCTAGSASRTGTGTVSPLTVTGLTNGTAFACSVTATNGAGTSAASATVSVTPATATAASVDPTKLPVGDAFVRTTGAGVGYAFMCTAGNPGAGGATVKGPWFNSDGTTFNSLTKLIVSGVVSWVSSFTTALSGTTRSANGNGLPSHTTGTFPVAASDPVAAYDRNPNTISAQTIAWGLPGSPTANATPTCLNGGSIGVLLTGVRLFAPTDALNRDAVAWEAQDSCEGHPEMTGAYHYHSISSCLSQTAATRDTAGTHSPLVGYAADGFGIYGNLGEGGVALTNAALDECHGHSHAVTINGASVVQYHYHKTREFPYALGCYRGTPVRVS